MDEKQAWDAIEAAESRTLAQLFAAEPDRLSRLTLDLPGLHFDFSKTHLSAPVLAGFEALAWMEQSGVADPYGRVVALTAAPERAIEFGIDETRILPFENPAYQAPFNRRPRPAAGPSLQYGKPPTAL